MIGAFPAVSADALGRFRRHLLPSGEHEAFNANGSLVRCRLGKGRPRPNLSEKATEVIFA